MLDTKTKAEMICHMLSGSGYEAYEVGGCVRDSWLEKTPKDYDITTNATPDQIKEVFEQFQCLDIGAAFGIITVMVEGEPFEIATFREDSKSSDNRHPDEVKFASDITADLSRRDFTMNAIAWNIAKAEYVDPFGGIDDIINKKIKFVGDPAERIKEDHLRVLRAYRFVSQLGFDLEQHTRTALMLETRRTNILEGVSQERITAEMNKILVGKNCFHALFLMAVDGILWEIIPELKDQLSPHNNKWHLESIDQFGNSIFTHTLLVVDSASKSLHTIHPDHQVNFMWAALLHDISKVQCREIQLI
ncbi:MAG: CCA tRNA nucleotidyltransferase [Oscillospiraceae bacterium]|jgi:tRNA nucleotidyltransferase (CCA-adding enzyme)|nr:CCA tRNA nucleotidyltransferase [Oscillospiraceae bacterium]